MLMNFACFDRFFFIFALVGTMSFMIGAIDGWLPPCKHLMVERRVNNVTGEGAVGVPVQQV